MVAELKLRQCPTPFPPFYVNAMCMCTISTCIHARVQVYLRAYVGGLRGFPSFHSEVRFPWRVERSFSFLLGVLCVTIGLVVRKAQVGKPIKLKIKKAQFIKNKESIA